MRGKGEGVSSSIQVFFNFVCLKTIKNASETAKTRLCPVRGVQRLMENSILNLHFFGTLPKVSSHFLLYQKKYVRYHVQSVRQSEIVRIQSECSQNVVDM